MVMEAPNECLRKEDSNRFSVFRCFYIFRLGFGKIWYKVFFWFDDGSRKREKRWKCVGDEKYRQDTLFLYLDNSNFDWYLSIGKGISMMDRGEDRGVLKE